MTGDAHPAAQAERIVLKMICRASLLVAVVLACPAALQAQNRRAVERAEVGRLMAVTIDDLPVANESLPVADQEAVTDRLLRTLRVHGVRAVGFVNESKLEVGGEVDPRRVRLLERWLEDGHELGNHGYSHQSLHAVTPEVWLEDVARGESITRGLGQRYSRPLRFFRHPFLHTGLSVEIQRETTRLLQERGYRVAPVTIDNADYVYAGAYDGARVRHDSLLMARIGKDYVAYMLAVVQYYEGQAAAIVGDGLERAPLAEPPQTSARFPQILLVHASALNADWLGVLLTELHRRGWQWTPLEEALRHPAYERSIAGWTKPGGITWLHRWALTDGMPARLFRGEPEVPTWVVSLYDSWRRLFQ